MAAVCRFIVCCCRCRPAVAVPVYSEEVQLTTINRWFQATQVEDQSMSSHLSSALAKCKIEDIEFVSILQVYTYTYLRCARVCFIQLHPDRLLWAAASMSPQDLGSDICRPLHFKVRRLYVLSLRARPDRARVFVAGGSKKQLLRIHCALIPRQVTHPFLNPSLSTLQDEKFVYVLSKFPVGGEIFAHLAAAGFFNEEVPQRLSLFEHHRALRRACSDFYRPAHCICRLLASTLRAWSERTRLSSFFCLSVMQVLFLESLHSKGYIFRNIKPESLLIDSEG